ncbi:MAG: LysM peptidoglycan-binding domain-containing protein [Mobilitalea sp.]
MYCINYVIKKGDTLYSISRHFSVGIDAIMTANPLIDLYNLMIGEEICIPVSVPQNNYTNYTTYLVEEEDTLGSVLNKHSINLADLLEFNELNDVYLMPGMTIQVPIIDEGENGITL